MTIGIDASRALRPHRTGTEVHNAEIIKHMVALDHRTTFRLYASRPPFGDMAEIKQPNVEWKVMPFMRGWTLVRLSAEMIASPPDVLFVPAHTLPLIAPKKSVLMIHDIGFDHFPEIYPWIDKAYHHFAIAHAKRAAAHILTPSEFTKRDLHQVYGIPLGKMTAVYHGFDPSSYRPAKSGEASPEQKPYFYFIGRLELKKNIVTMLEAFATFKQHTKKPHLFILAGKPGYGYEAIAQKLDSIPPPIRQDIKLLGYVTQDRATQYLRHAQALLFCTLFEGFGIPALEAFASGVPVIASNTTSLPEVVGEAGVLVNPTDALKIADALTRVAGSATLRAELVANGNKQYKKFSWTKAANQTLDILKRVAATPPSHA